MVDHYLTALSVTSQWQAALVMSFLVRQSGGFRDISFSFSKQPSHQHNASLILALALALSNSHLTPFELDFLNLTIITNVANLRESYHAGHIWSFSDLHLSHSRSIKTDESPGSHKMANTHNSDGYLLWIINMCFMVLRTEWNPITVLSAVEATRSFC